MEKNNFDNMTIEELKDFLNNSEEKNKNLAKLLKDKSVEIKNLKLEIEKQYELIGKLVEEKKALQTFLEQTSNREDNQEDPTELSNLKLEEANKTIASLEEKNNILEEQLSKFQNNELSLEKIDINYKDQLIEKEELVKSLNDELTKSKNNLNALEKENDNLRDNIQDLNNRLCINKELTLSVDNPSLLSRVVNNTLDLELNGYVNQDVKKLSKDLEIKKLFSNITEILKSNDTGLENKTNQVLDELSRFINDEIKKEASCFDYLVALRSLEKEYNDYKTSSSNTIEELKAVIENENNENLKEDNVSNDSDLNTLTVTINNLKKENELLLSERDRYLKELEKIRQDSSNPEIINELLDLLSLERNEHALAEKVLKLEIDNLKEHNNSLNQELTKLSSDYLVNEIDKKLEVLNDYVSKVINGEIEYESSLFNKYYGEALKQFEKQKIIYKEEIDKRDEILTKIFVEKNKELSRLENLDVATYNLAYGTNLDLNGVRSKISDLKLFVSYIDRVLNTKVVNIEIESKKSIDEKIIDEFKEKINSMYKDMVYRINDKAYDYVDSIRKMTVSEVMDLYKKDCNEMAKFYAKEINQLYLINDVNSNEFSKLLNNAKIMMLCNEFYTLVNFKQSKYYQKANKEEITDFTVKINDNFISSLKGNEEIKTMLLGKKDNLESSSTQKINQCENEISVLKDSLDDLNYKLDNAQAGINVKEINECIINKKEQLEKLNIELANFKDEYQVALSDLNMKIALTQSNEKETKQIYLDRATLSSNGLKDIEKNINDISYIYGMKKVNEYLFDLNAIDYAYINAYNQNDEKLNNIITEYQSKSEILAKVILEYRDLVRLKNEYSLHAKEMRADYEAIRDYERNIEKSNGQKRQLTKYENQLKKAKENVEFGIDIDNNKDAMVMFYAKILSLKKQIEKSSDEIIDLKNINVISEYISVIDKIKMIDDLIKNKEREI